MFIVQGKRYTEDPNLKLGGGSEGAVYPFEGDASQCIKLFHETDPNDKGAVRIAQYRAQKVGAICKMGLHLPPQFILPLHPALDTKNNVIGFLMKRVPKGYGKLRSLLEEKFRKDHTVGLKEILRLFATIFEDLEIVHLAKRVIGDINMGCLLIRATLASGIITLDRAWVDTDSWSHPGFPCLATSEMFAHPDLYPNLKSGGTFVEPEPEHDRFSFTEMLVLIGLMGAHPFRMGSHPKVRSLQERTEKGITIFDRDVKYPTFLQPAESFSDDLLQRIILILKRKQADGLDPNFLRAAADETILCPQCAFQYHVSRKQCPKCQVATTVQMPRMAELLVEEIFKTAGDLLWAQVVQDTLRMACRDKKGQLEIVSISIQGKPERISTGLPATPGAEYRFFSSCLVICSDPYADPPLPLTIYKLESGGLSHLADQSTGQLENDAAVFGASPRHFYRTAGNTLLCGSLFGGKTFVDDPVMQVHRSQTWFTVDDSSGADREAVFGYNRALREWQWFVVSKAATADRFSSYDVTPALLRSLEKLEDFSVTFGADTVLLTRSTRYQGQQFIRSSIIGLDGRVQRDDLIAQNDPGYAHWENIQGKLLQKNSILHVTPQGVVKQTLATNAYNDLADTSGMVTTGDLLFPFGKSVGVMTRNRVLTIKKKP